MLISNQFFPLLWSWQHFYWSILSNYYNPASQLNKYNLIMLIMRKCCPPWEAFPSRVHARLKVNFGWAQSTGTHTARRRHGTCRKVAAAQALGAVREQQPKSWQQRHAGWWHLRERLATHQIHGNRRALSQPISALLATTHGFFPPVTNRTPLFPQQQPALSSSYGTGFCACSTY